MQNSFALGRPSFFSVWAFDMWVKGKWRGNAWNHPFGFPTFDQNEGLNGSMICVEHVFWMQSAWRDLDKLKMAHCKSLQKHKGERHCIQMWTIYLIFVILDLYWLYVNVAVLKMFILTPIHYDLTAFFASLVALHEPTTRQTWRSVQYAFPTWFERRLWLYETYPYHPCMV